MANSKRDRRLHVACVIESDPNQMIGAAMQRLSLCVGEATPEHHVCILTQAPAASSLTEFAAQLQNVHWVRPRSENPFLNKWAFLDALSDLHHDTRLLYLDWDIIASRAEWTGRLEQLGAGILWARPNPSQMYSQVLARIQAESGRDIQPQLVSINSGVILASLRQLQELSEKTFHWYHELTGFSNVEPPWLLEQLAASLAVGQLPFRPLDSACNVTPLSPVEDMDVLFWHYNDGDANSRLLKRSLTRPEIVRVATRDLSRRWPLCVERFLALYESARGTPACKPLFGSIRIESDRNDIRTV